MFIPIVDRGPPRSSKGTCENIFGSRKGLTNYENERLMRNSVLYAYLIAGLKMHYTTNAAPAGSSRNNKLEGASGMAERLHGRAHACCEQITPDSDSETPGHSETGGQLLFSPSHPSVRSKRRCTSSVSLAADGDLLFIQLRKLTSNVLLEFREINKVGPVRTCWARAMCVCTPPLAINSPLRQPSNQLMWRDRCTVRLDSLH